MISEMITMWKFFIKLKCLLMLSQLKLSAQLFSRCFSCQGSFTFLFFFFSRSNGSKFDYFGYVFRTKKTSMTSCQIHNISHTWNTNDANSQVTAFWNVSSWEKHHKMGPFLPNGLAMLPVSHIGYILLRKLLTALNPLNLKNFGTIF